MVGVPGRSKGCNTCIQRKIKCDQETPLCGNCRKSSRLCTGYRRKLGYVLSRDVRLGDLAEPGRDGTTVTYQGRWRKFKSPQPPLATHQAAKAPPSWTDFLPSLYLCSQVSPRTALRQQFHYIFLNDHLPAEMLDRTRPISDVPMSWIIQLQDAVIDSPVLESSITTFFAARVGRKNNDMDLVLQSRSMYVRGLERVQHALNDPETQLSDETLAACMALLFYEMTENSVGAPNAFSTHHKGAMMLLHMRGPDASAPQLGHNLFLQLRAMAVLGSLIGRRSTFFSSPEWMERPWKIIPKTPLDEINDALFIIPAIFEQFDQLSFDTNQSVLQDGLRDVVSKLLAVESILQCLYARLEKSVSGPLYWPELSTIEVCPDDATAGKVFPVSFHFPAFRVGQVITAYWSGMMAVHDQLMFAYDKLATIESSEALKTDADSPLCPTATGIGLCPAVPSHLRSWEHRDIWKTMAMNICKSAEYFLQDNKGELGGFFMIALLSGSLSCLKNFPDEYGREMAWILELIGRIREKFNLPSAPDLSIK